MAINVYEAAENLLKKIPPGWRTGTSSEHPLQIVKRNDGGHPKWQVIGGVTAGELDVILRTSASVDHAADRIIRKIMHNDDGAAAQNHTNAEIRAMISEEMTKALAALKSALVEAAAKQQPPQPEDLPDEPEQQPVSTVSTPATPEPEPPAKKAKEAHTSEDGLEQLPDVKPSPYKKRGRPAKTEKQKLAEIDDWKTRCTMMGIQFPSLASDGFMRPEYISRLKKKWKVWSKANEAAHKTQWEEIAKEIGVDDKGEPRS